MSSRFSLSTLRKDYWRSLVRYESGEPDLIARTLLVVAPPIAGVISLALGLRLADPVALLPATSLLAGVLLAAGGQVITLRGRIADSLTLAEDPRLRAHLRETVSGVLLAALLALLTAFLLGFLALIDAKVHSVAYAVLTAVTVAAFIALGLLFVATCRRLYATYLEAFEGGAPLTHPKVRQRRNESTSNRG